MRRMLLIMLGSCIALLPRGCENDDVEASWSLIYPDGPETLVKGVSYTISWLAPPGSSVSIDLYHGSAYHSGIAEEVPNTGKFEWIIAENIPAGSDYSIKIWDLADPGLFAMNKISFSLLEPGTLSTYTDSRDGRIYTTVKLGEQTWMAENFNYDPGEGTYCYLGNSAYCETLGRLYTHEAAIAHPPEGWHLPSDDEWKQLELYLGMDPEELNLFGDRGLAVGEILRPGKGSGFNAYFAGYYNHCFGEYGHKSYEAHYWSSSQTQDSQPILRIVGNQGSIIRLASSCHMGSSVRYIMD